MKSTAPTNPDRMTTAEAAEYLGFEESTLVDWRYDGKANRPPYTKLGGKVFYRQSALDKWIEKNTVNPVK
jgi:excisionase family DNA binding protein